MGKEARSRSPRSGPRTHGLGTQTHRSRPAPALSPGPEPPSSPRLATTPDQRGTRQWRRALLLFLSAYWAVWWRGPGQFSLLIGLSSAGAGRRLSAGTGDWLASLSLVSPAALGEGEGGAVDGRGARGGDASGGAAGAPPGAGKSWKRCQVSAGPRERGGACGLRRPRPGAWVLQSGPWGPCSTPVVPIWAPFLS